MGKGRLTPIRPAGTRNLGTLIDHGVKVRATCDRCRFCKDVDLDALAEKMGRDFDLWNRRPLCKVPGCDGTVLFMHNWHGGFFFPMKDRDAF